MTRNEYRQIFKFYFLDENWFQDICEEDNEWAWCYFAEYFICE